MVTATNGFPTGASDRTLELWARIDTLPKGSDESFFAGYGAFGTGQGTYQLGAKGDGPFFSQWGEQISGPPWHDVETWHHVAVTTASGASTLYFDGSPVASAALPIATSPGSSLHIGSIPFQNVSRAIIGAVDEVSVYDRALAEDEISAIYAAGGAGKCANEASCPKSRLCADVCCPPDASCTGGTCHCPGNTNYCPATRACVDFQSDAGNCGGCGVTCPSVASCTAGRCECPKPTLPAGAPALTLCDYPKVDGSTSTYPLDMVLGCELFGVPWAWVQEPDLTLGIEPRPETSKQRGIAGDLRRLVVHNKTDPAYMNLIDRQKDLIFVASLPSDSEKQAATAAGVELEPKALALDGLVFFLNADNPVHNLSLDQVRKIYTGEIANWKEVGGNDAAIQPYARQENSGSQELMDGMVMKGQKMGSFPNYPQVIQLVATMSGIVESVNADPNGIGYGVYYFVTFQYPVKGIQIVSLNQVSPTAQTLSSGSYPLASPVYSVIRTDLPSSSLAYQLRDFLLAPEGQNDRGEERVCAHRPVSAAAARST